MSRIKYINSEVYFAKEYKDGIIVAFRNIGDNNSSYADQIHTSVYFGVDLFASDIIESISVTNSHKDSIKDSLFIYVKNGVSISACRIILCLNKDYIEVKYNSEAVLSIKNKRLNKFGRVFIPLIICVLGSIIFVNGYKTKKQDLTVEQEKETQTEPQIKTEKKDGYFIENKVTTDNKEEAPLTIATETSMDIADDKRYVEKEINKTSAIESQYNAEDKQSSVEYKKKQNQEGAERDRQIKALKAEANEYVRIADQAYNDYAESFNESKGSLALKNYKRALDLNKKHGLFSISEIENIEKKVKAIEYEFK